MAYLIIPSKMGDQWVLINKKDKMHILDYQAGHAPWRVEFDDDGRPKVPVMTIAIAIASHPGRKRGYKTHQIRLDEFIVGGISKCQAIRHRDRDPLNNMRNNLSVYYKYEIKDILEAKGVRKRTNICVRCRSAGVCRKVPVGPNLEKLNKEKSHANQNG